MKVVLGVVIGLALFVGIVWAEPNRFLASSADILSEAVSAIQVPAAEVLSVGQNNKNNESNLTLLRSIFSGVEEQNSSLNGSIVSLNNQPKAGPHPQQESETPALWILLLAGSMVAMTAYALLA